MANLIKISKTFTEFNPDTAENGDFSDHGFIEEMEEVTFIELLELMRRHPFPSQCPYMGQITASLSSGYEITNFRTGTQRETSIHYHKDNEKPNAHYWELAAILVKLEREINSREFKH
jgi:hypothetical protein